MHTFGMDKPEIRSYFDGKSISYELATRYDEYLVEINFYDHRELSANADGILIDETSVPNEVRWELKDGEDVLVSDQLLFMHIAQHNADSEGITTSFTVTYGRVSSLVIDV